MTAASRAGGVGPMLAKARAAGGDVAADDVRAFAERVTAALRSGVEALAEWRAVLAPIVAAAGRGHDPFNVDARTLYDIERACTASEQELFTVDVLGWVRYLGARPIRRTLPLLREVHIVKSLRSALERAPHSRAGDEARARFEDLLRRGVERAEANLRAALRPPTRAAFAEIGLAVTSTLDVVAENKLVEELIDVAVVRGQLSLGLLRDAFSRNALKLDNLHGVHELMTGDPLLRADDRLSVRLDGVYRRGESYLRLLDRASELLFATQVGRFLTRFVLLPLGGAYVGLEGVQHVASPLTAIFFHRHLHHFVRPMSLVVTSLLLFALIHSPYARAGALAMLRAVGVVLHAIFVAAPRWIARLPLVRAFVTSGPVAAALRYVDARLAPLKELTRRVLPGLLGLLSGFFGALLEQFERGIYAVDTWLRYRGGAGWWAVALKAVVGSGWAVVSYVLRIYVNVLIEPQLNPLKHFPVVTVAAKIIYTSAFPAIDHIVHALEKLMPTGAAVALTVSSIFLSPGLFGFLVWELKENYKLYRQNERSTLTPVVIGHHGESMAALLLPGLHSGTIPKTYAKLGRASSPRARLTQREALHHIEEAIRRFVERELVELLAVSPLFAARAEVGRIDLTAGRVGVELACPAVAPDSAMLAFAVESQALVARVERGGWIDALDDTKRVVVENALVGLCARAAVDGVVVTRVAWAAAWEARGAIPRVATGPSLLPPSAAGPHVTGTSYAAGSRCQAS